MRHMPIVISPSRNRKILFLSFMIVIITLSNYIFLQHNEREYWGDEPGHLITSVDFYHNPFLFFTSERPPIPFMTTALMYHVFGISKNTAILLNIIWLCLSLISIYNIASYLYNSKAGFIAAIVFMCFPSTIGMTRMYMIENCETAIVSLAVWQLIKTEHLIRRVPSVLLGIFCGAGILTKVAFPVYLLGPFMIILFQISKDVNPITKLQIKNFSFILIIAFLIAILWSPEHFIDRFMAVLDVSKTPANNLDLTYLQGIMLYLYSLIDFSVGFYFYLFMMGIVWLIYKRQKGVALLLAWILVPLLLLNIFPWKLARYIFPAIPSIAIVIGISSAYISNRLIQIFLMSNLIWVLFFISQYSVYDESKYDLNLNLIETEFYQKFFSKWNLNPRRYREDFWIKKPRTGSLNFDTIIRSMDAHNLNRNDLTQIRDCYVVLGPFIDHQGEKHHDIPEHPLNWPIETHVKLKQHNYDIRYIYYNENKFSYWHPGLREDEVVPEAPFFIIYLNRCDCDILETGGIGYLGSVGSYYGCASLFVRNALEYKMLPYCKN